MSCFQLPKGLCHNMDKCSLSFWWNSDDSCKSIHWIRKDILQREKSRGVLGFRFFESLNIAMLMKQLWRVLTNSELFISKIFKHKYFRNTALFDIRSKPRDSCVWKSISETIQIFKSGLELLNGNVWR